VCVCARADAFNADNYKPLKASRDRDFLEVIMATLRADGSVLIPVDTAGRVLELLLLLERHWCAWHTRQRSPTGAGAGAGSGT
jgi:cleavage and polyadenylation specificity factor subunit 2